MKEQACLEQLSNLQNQRETAKVEVQKPFPREEELKGKVARLEELNTLLDLDHKEAEITDAEPDEAPRPRGRPAAQMERLFLTRRSSMRYQDSWVYIEPRL